MRELPEELEIELVKRVGLLAACFPQTAIAAQTIKVYAKMLADLPLDTLDAAIEQAAAECKFFPSVAELRDMALRLSTVSGLRPDSAEAWGQVIAQIRAVGSWGRPAFEDDLVARAVGIIGWRELCVSENPVADRAHFLRIYEQLAAREVEDAKLMPAARRLRALTAEAAGRARMEAPSVIPFKARGGQGSEQNTAA